MGPAVWVFDVLSGVRACGGLGNGGVSVTWLSGKYPLYMMPLYGGNTLHQGGVKGGGDI